MVYKEMRKKERQIDKEEIEGILKNAEYGILATVSEDNTPYAVPLSFVYDDGRIYFHCAKDTGHKLKNIENENQVCFTVVGKTEVLASKFSAKYESVVIFGRAKEAGRKKENILKKLLEKYCRQYLDKGVLYLERAAVRTAVYEIEIQHVTGKARKN